MMSNDTGENAISSYRDLKVWQEGMTLAQTCYELTRTFPREEAFGMTSQIRRSAASVPANIAEGYGRDSKGEYVQFLRIAQGSLKEAETHLLLAQRVGLTTVDGIQPILDRADRLGRMLRALYRSLQKP
jgi:four helix bundle protein